MREQRFLHEGERLLCTQGSTPAVFLYGIVRGLMETLVGLIIIMVGIGAVALFAGIDIPWVLIAILAFILLCSILAQRYRIFRHAALRITTERILIGNPLHFFHAPEHTIKWPQYQESTVGRRSPMDLLFFSRPLRIRYGTADAKQEIAFPSLLYAEDLKHYLDKVDSLVRSGKGADLKPFIAKPRGKRDSVPSV
jgi:hypothetical protein